MEKEAYSYWEISLEEAISLMKEHLPYEKGAYTEEVSLMDSLGRIAARDYISPIDQPPFPRSPLDGYAVRAEDTKGAAPSHPVVLQVVEEITAGDFPTKKITEGTAARIMTGAPIPEGADCILRQEDTDYGETETSIYQECRAYDNYCFAGEDFGKGDCLISRDTYLSSVELGVLASMGFTKVLVYRKPRIGLFTTGDELVAPGGILEPGKIYNSNLYALWGRLKELGAEPVIASTLPDTEEGVARAMENILPGIDIMITTGGVSVGKKDIMHEALKLLGAERIFWKVRIKPGTPTIFAMAKGVPIIALSGNPFGAVTNLELLVRPILFEMTGNEDMFPMRKRAVMQDSYQKASNIRRFIRGMYQDGKVYQPKGLQSSGILGSMRGCNCLIDIPAGNQGLKPEDEVEVVLLN